MKTDESPLLALAGNPNAGKTTVFNLYTGARQHVGNYPGITVEKKEGAAFVDGRQVRIIDLPGTYSLSAYTEEEKVARQVIAREKPLVVMSVLNSAALERNLYLVVQLLEMGVPVSIALNMMDEAKAQGVVINHKLLSEKLKLPVVPTVARTGEGLDDFLKQSLAFGLSKQNEEWQPLKISYGPDLDIALEKLMQVLPHEEKLIIHYPRRWLAIKILEKDSNIISSFTQFSPDIAQKAQNIVNELEKHTKQTLNTSPEALIADYRYGYISALLKDNVLVREDNIGERYANSDRADKVLTHPVLGPILMFSLMYLMYIITFNLGSAPMEWVGMFFGSLRGIADNILPDGYLKSLVIAGIIDGVGGVMTFVPLILIIFLQIAFLEDSGYMARMAYMLDRIFRFFGLHGCSVMPYILGGGIAGGCAVPGIMATRTLRSPREKLATLLTVPFMACGAKLPVFILIAGVFFPAKEAFVMFALTLTGWAVALITARILRSTIIKGAPTPFVMELPPYRLPTVRGLCIHSFERTWEYLRKAGTVILAISILLWAAMTFPSVPQEAQLALNSQKTSIQSQISLLDAETSSAEIQKLNKELLLMDQRKGQMALEYSLAGRLGKTLEPVTLYAGFDAKTNIALIGGFAAKEVTVSTLATAYALQTEDNASLSAHIAADSHWTMANAVSFLLFVLLYAPCFVSLVAIKQESGSVKWAFFSLIMNTVLAFGVAVFAYQILK